MSRAKNKNIKRSTWLVPPSASGLSPTAPAPTSFAAIRHDPDLLERYYRALDVYHNALGSGLNDAERQKLADTITRGGLWKELDELRARQDSAAAEYYSPKAPQAEDFGLRHPGYSPTPPLLKTGYQVYDSSAGGGLAQAGRPPLFQAIDMIKARKGSAKDTIQYLLDQTYGTPAHLPIVDDPLGRIGRSHFGGIGAIPSDSGFQSQFQDDYLYGTLWGKQTPESKQLGHFLTAVDMGYGDVDKSAIIKHEQIPDTKLGKIGALFEAMAIPASPEDVAAFNWAIVYDMQGDNASRDAMLMSILSPEKHGDLSQRQGNSLEDLRLSVRGWELGRDIALGVIKTNDELADWIALNIAGGYY